MTTFDTRSQRAAAEADFEQLSIEDVGSGNASAPSAVVSVRFRRDELALIERAATAAGLPVSTMIRQAALMNARPVDIRALRTQADEIAREMRALVAMLETQ